MRERIFGADHAIVALSLRNLATTHERAGNAVAAASYRERATAMGLLKG